MQAEERHCDFYIHDLDAPMELRWYLFVNRLPAVDTCFLIDKVGDPKLFAKYKDEWIRVVMASRFGDVGITNRLDEDSGYSKRVCVADLSEFTDVPPSEKPR